MITDTFRRPHPGQLAFAMYFPKLHSRLVYIKPRAVLATGIFLLMMVGLLSPARAQETVRIMALGDSITRGTMPQVPGGYRTKLYETLTAAGLKVKMVGSSTENPSPLLEKEGQASHEGHGGYTIGAVRDSVDGIFKDSKPDVICLQLGTNNLAWGKTEAAADTAAEMSGLIEQIFKFQPGVLLVVAGLTPLGDDSVHDPTTTKARAKEYDRLLEKEVVPHFASEGRKIVFVDLWTPFVKGDGDRNPELFADGLHQSQKGQDIMGEAFAQAILT